MATSNSDVINTTSESLYTTFVNISHANSSTVMTALTSVVESESSLMYGSNKSNTTLITTGDSRFKSSKQYNRKFTIA